MRAALCVCVYRRVLMFLVVVVVSLVAAYFLLGTVEVVVVEGSYRIQVMAR